MVLFPLFSSFIRAVYGIRALSILDFSSSSSSSEKMKRSDETSNLTGIEITFENRNRHFANNSRDNFAFRKERKKERLLVEFIQESESVGFRKFRRKKAEENWFAEHGDNDRKSIVFRHEVMTSRGFCSTSLACAIAWKKKKIARENVQGARLTKLIWSRETRLERSLRNLVWKFNNERRTFEERKLRTLRLSSVRKVKLKKFLFTFSLLRLQTVVRVFRTRFPTCSFARGPRDRMANA